MRRNLWGATAVVFLIGLTASAVAQQPGQRGGPPGGRGGFGGFGGFGTSRMSLLRIPEVRKELELADEQVAAIEKLQEEARARFRGPGGAGGGPGGQRRGRGDNNNQNNGALNRVPAGWYFVQAQNQDQQGRRGRGGFGQLTDEQRAEFEKRRLEQTREENAKLADILLPQQLKRLNEIYIQQAGVSALQDEEVSKELGISDAQKKKIAEVQAANRESMGAQMRELFQGGDRDAARAKMDEIRKANDAKVLAVLSPDQQKKFEEMKGKPFTMPENAGRGGFGGNRGRGTRGGNNNNNN